MARIHAAGVPTTRRWRQALVAAGAATAILGSTVGTAVAFDFGPIEPVAIFTATPTSGTAPLVVTFDGSGSLGPNPLVTWDWTFGDGTTGTGMVTTHTYSTPGTYVASLVVTDILGLAGPSRSVQIDVAPRTAPGAPTSLTATAVSRTSIVLAWTNATSDQSSVRVERCKGTGCAKFALVATLAGSATAFTDAKLSPGTTYTYRVRAANDLGTSPFSNLASARTLR
jgi:PKD repeat protein